MSGDPVYAASLITWDKRTGYVEAEALRLVNSTVPESLYVKSDKTGTVKKFIYFGSVTSTRRGIRFIHYRHQEDNLSIIVITKAPPMIPHSKASDYEAYL